MGTVSCLIVLLLVHNGAIAAGECGERFLTARDISSFLESPGYSNNYENNMDCTWTIEARNVSEAVSVKVLDSALEGRSIIYGLCIYDNLTAYDGPYTSSRMIWSWCGTETPNILSTGRYLTLRLQTDKNVVKTRFRLKYQQIAARCGAQLFATVQSQYLSSPGFRSLHSNSLNCTWTIRTRQPRIKLEVTDSSLGLSTLSCIYNKVKVYDGALNRLLGTFCGPDAPTYISSSSLVKIVFTTDSRFYHRGFQMKYTGGDFQAMESCGSPYIIASGHARNLTSPGYPSGHMSNLDCTWHIRTPVDGYNIRLVVLVSDIASSPGCVYDSVTVYDGSSTDGKLLGTFCGTQKPKFTSSSNSVTVTLKTYSNNNEFRHGFILSYQSAAGPDPSRCGSASLRAYDFNRYLASPNYPNYYTNYLNCTWVITANSVSTIKLVVLNADIESRGCIFDTVKVFDGSTADAPLLGTFCGSQTPTYVSSDNAVTVNFKTDGNTVRKGFKLSYKSGHFEVCRHRDLTLSYSSKLIITSPSYPLEYPNGADCTWTINSGYNDYIVHADVTYLDIEYRIGCSADYLQAMDGRNAYSPELAKWCGKVPPSPKQSSGQYMFISFHSNGNTKLTGFKMQFSSKDKATKSHSYSNLGAIIGGIAAGCVLLICIICFAAYRSRKNTVQRPEHSNHASRVSTQRRHIYVIGGNESETNTAPTTFTGPPSYDEVIASDQGRRDEAAEGPPPPYSSLYAVAEMHASNSNAKVTEDDAGTGDDLGADAPDTHPILPRERDPKDHQGLDNLAGAALTTPQE